MALKYNGENGNYGLGDQINALDWVCENIRNLLRWADRTTIFGQSAGAASARALMVSYKAVGKIGGDTPLSGISGGDQGATDSKYPTIDEKMKIAGDAILNAVSRTASTPRPKLTAYVQSPPALWRASAKWHDTHLSMEHI